MFSRSGTERRFFLVHALICAALAAAGCKTAPSQQTASLADIEAQEGRDAATASFCGGKLFPGRDVSAAREDMAGSSDRAVAALRRELGPLQGDEKRLYEAAISMPPYLVHRLPFASLRAVLARRRLISPGEASFRADTTVNRAVTPGIEQELYGAFDCVFISVNPPLGIPRYGEVMIRFPFEAPSERFFWASTSSGYFFVTQARKSSCEAQCGCATFATGDAKAKACVRATDSDNASEAFVFADYRAGAAYDCHQACDGLTKGDIPSSYVLPQPLRDGFKAEALARDDWNEYLALHTVRLTRGFDGARRAEVWPLIDAVLAEKPSEARRAKFRQLIDDHRLGYLEGRIDRFIDLSEAERITVPKERLEEVLGWEESAPFRRVLGAGD